jgi:hypothetical protein
MKQSAFAVYPVLKAVYDRDVPHKKTEEVGRRLMLATCFRMALISISVPVGILEMGAVFRAISTTHQS